MEREDIEKEAQKNSERIANISYSGGGHIGQDDLEKAFYDGVEWFKNHLFHRTKDEVPQPLGKYEDEAYPQIPCLVLGHLSTGYGYGVRYWNVEYQVWDDEECDDVDCEKDSVEKWCYLDDLIQDKEE